MSDQAQETPLIELARMVPKNLRSEWASQFSEDGRATGYSMAPVGKYLHELADELTVLLMDRAALRAENAALKRELERANAFHERLANRLEIRQDPDGSMYDEIDRLRFENAALMERTQIGPELIETIKMCEARATRMMRGEDAGIAPIVSCFRDILSAVAPPGEQK